MPGGKLLKLNRKVFLRSAILPHTLAFPRDVFFSFDISLSGLFHVRFPSKMFQFSEETKVRLSHSADLIRSDC